MTPLIGSGACAALACMRRDDEGAEVFQSPISDVADTTNGLFIPPTLVCGVQSTSKLGTCPAD